MFFSFFPSSSSKGKVLKKRERREPNPTTSPNHLPSRERRPFHPPPASNPTPQPQSSPQKRPRRSLISKILEARKKRIEEGRRAYAARDGPAVARTAGKGLKRGSSTLVKTRHDGKGRVSQQAGNAFIVPELAHVSIFTDIVIAMPAEQVPGLAPASGDESAQDHVQGERHELELTGSLAQLHPAHERGKRVNSDGMSSIGSESVHFVPSGEWVADWSVVSGADVEGSCANGIGTGRGYTSAYGGGVGYGGHGDFGGHGADFGDNGGGGM